MEFLDLLTRGWVTVRRLWRRQDPEEMVELAAPREVEPDIGIPLAPKPSRKRWRRRRDAHERERIKECWYHIPRCAIALRYWSPKFYRGGTALHGSRKSESRPHSLAAKSGRRSAAGEVSCMQRKNCSMGSRKEFTVWKP